MFITLERLKRELGIPAATTDDDALLMEKILEAQAYLEENTQRTFEVASDTTRYFDAVADVTGRDLYVDDLAAITSITNGDGTTVTSAQYVTKPTQKTPYFAIRLLSSAGISWTYSTDPENAIAIVGRWGYSVTPDTYTQSACLELARWMYRQKDTNADATRPILAGDGNVLLPDSMPSNVVRFIAHRRRMTT